MLGSVYPLKCFVQHYSWGIQGFDSHVYRLSGSSASPERCFAEMWIGAHKSLPSRILDGSSLFDFITQNPIDTLGLSAVNRFGSTLPFLMKVISVAHPLSIQLHPDKECAVRLHLSDPILYPDSNHKPEMSFALTDVELLYGFKNADALLADIDRLPPLKAAIFESGMFQHENSIGSGVLPGRSSECRGKCNDQLFQRRVLEVVASMRPETVETLCVDIERSIREGASESDNHRVFMRCLDFFPPSDRGLVIALLMNVVKLRSGEAIMIEPGMPHAYISGEMVECMASSDNVVRAGLTQKACDVKIFLSLVSYRADEDPRIKPLAQIGEGEFVHCESVRPDHQSPHTLSCYGSRWDDFRLQVVSCEQPNQFSFGCGPGLILSDTAFGELSVSDSKKSGESGICIEPGSAFFLPARRDAVNMSVSQGRLFVASTRV